MNQQSSALPFDRHALHVRLVRQDERARWRELMHAHHYLGFTPIIGEALCYVACVDEQWVALLGWGSAALKCAARDQWIGWSPAQQYRRLPLVANNVRFLVLPAWHYPNLASRVLALNLRRLSADWERCHGHRLVLAETFVDASRFKGTCYLAAGWQALGYTRGFAKRNTQYWYHGRRKQILVRSLAGDAPRLLAGAFDPPIRTTDPEVFMLDVNALPLDGEGGLMELLRTIPDPRKARGIRYSVATVLGIAVCATLSGARSLIAIGEWARDISPEALRTLGTKYRRPPSEPTIRRLLQSIDAAEVDARVGHWLMGQLAGKGRALAIDGKAMRHAHKAGERAPQLLSAILHEEALVIGQIAIESKTNEIPKLPELLERIAPEVLQGAVITADALHTQVHTARAIVERHQADYLLTAKDNQPALRESIAQLNLAAFSPCAPEYR